MTTVLHRLLAYLRTTPVIDAIDPPSAADRIAAARRETGERARMRGIGTIMSASQSNIVHLAERRKQLTACCESSPFRKSVQ